MQSQVRSGGSAIVRVSNNAAHIDLGPPMLYTNKLNNFRSVAWPSWSKALDLSILDSQWAKVHASLNLAATTIQLFRFLK